MKPALFPPDGVRGWTRKVPYGRWLALSCGSYELRADNCSGLPPRPPGASLLSGAHRAQQLVAMSYSASPWKVMTKWPKAAIAAARGPLGRPWATRRVRCMPLSSERRDQLATVYDCWASMSHPRLRKAQQAGAEYPVGARRASGSAPRSQAMTSHDPCFCSANDKGERRGHRCRVVATAHLERQCSGVSQRVDSPATILRRWRASISNSQRFGDSCSPLLG